MLYDISPLVSPRLAVWPGDRSCQREVLLDVARGDTVTLSTLHATVHLGAHADAPSHVAADGAGIDAVELHPYLGRCQVMHVAAAPGCGIEVADLPAPVTAPRILLATGTFPDPERWRSDFAWITPPLVDYLHQQGVCLVGIDTPSVDRFDSKELPAHHACRRRGIAILEGLVLAHVPAGRYELVALPLRLEGFDASPVRAVLRTAEGEEGLRRPVPRSGG
jgi:arylformamidase